MTRVLVPADIDAAGPLLGGQVHTVSGETMGTTWSVRWVGAPAAPDATWRAGLQATLDVVVAEMSHWLVTSDLSRFNRAAADTWHTLPQDFFDVLQRGLDVARASGGALDPTAGALVNRWGFGPTGRHDQPGFTPPSAAEVDTLRAVTGWQRLQLDVAQQRVHQPGGVVLDLSGIAKGFGVDAVVRHLQSRGVRDALVEVGGELRGIGMKPDGQPWWTAIERPPGAGHLPENRVALHGLAIATSGDYRRAYDHDGQHLAHTLDPRTGRPVANGVVSCTVLHPTCVMADAWSTALTVLGPVDGLALADREGLAVHLVVRTADGAWQEHWSRGFEDMLS